MPPRSPAGWLSVTSLIARTGLKRFSYMFGILGGHLCGAVAPHPVRLASAERPGTDDSGATQQPSGQGREQERHLGQRPHHDDGPGGGVQVAVNKTIVSLGLIHVSGRRVLYQCLMPTAAALISATPIARFTAILTGHEHDHGNFACVYNAELPRKTKLP
jgi:hypothetical protein